MYDCNKLLLFLSTQRYSTNVSRVELSSGEITGFVDWRNPSSRTMALGSTQPLTEMSTRNLPVGGGGKKRPARKDDNLTAICEPIV
jgi:hypothetical protein